MVVSADPDSESIYSTGFFSNGLGSLTHMRDYVDRAGMGRRFGRAIPSYDGDVLTLSRGKTRGMSGMLPFEARHLTSASAEFSVSHSDIQRFLLLPFLSHLWVSVFSTRDSKLGGSRVCGPDLPGEGLFSLDFLSTGAPT